MLRETWREKILALVDIPSNESNQGRVHTALSYDFPPFYSVLWYQQYPSASHEQMVFANLTQD
jgi:hypothetical protein